MKKLAAAAGVDPSDDAAVRRFDRRRPGRKSSNDEWKNPHDPDAKIGRSKRGATRMIYKPEHVIDLETGAIVDADVRPGDEHDTEDLTDRLLCAEARMNQGLGDSTDTERMEVVAGDKGYFKLQEIALLQELGVQTVVSDPQLNRRLDRLTTGDRAALEAARCAVRSDLGKQLARARAEKVERSFEHVLDCGGARQTTLRGRENIRKRYLDPGRLREPLAPDASSDRRGHPKTGAGGRVRTFNRLVFAHIQLSVGLRSPKTATSPPSRLLPAAFSESLVTQPPEVCRQRRGARKSLVQRSLKPRKRNMLPWSWQPRSTLDERVRAPPQSHHGRPVPTPL